MGGEIIDVEEQLERRMGRVARPMEEVSMIIDLTRDLCDGDVVKADRLLHRVLFEMYNRTWGVSLFEGDPDQPLAETGNVCEYLRLANQSWSAGDLKKLAQRAVSLAASRPHQILLYRSMVYEMGGARELKAFEGALAMREVRLPRLDGEDVRIYQRLVGKSYWELDVEMLQRVFVSNFMAWRVGMVKFGELEDEGVKQPEFLAEVSVFLTWVRVELRRIARVIVAKNVLPERKTVGFLRERVDEGDGSTDTGIDLETARQFLD